MVRPAWYRRSLPSARRVRRRRLDPWRRAKGEQDYGCPTLLVRPVAGCSLGRPARGRQQPRHLRAIMGTCARGLNQRSIPHRTIIDDTGATVRSVPNVLVGRKRQSWCC
jgi:hypothetical protein